MKKATFSSEYKMLIDFIARYYKFLWLALIAIGVIKVLLSYSFNAQLEGTNRILYALFKWYNDDEQQLEDFAPRRTMMRVHNIVTLTMYGIIGMIFFASLITMYLPGG